MTHWYVVGILICCSGCGDDTQPSPPLPVDTYDGSLFDARRPFDPLSPESRPGYGAVSGSGANQGDGASGAAPVPDQDDAILPSPTSAETDLDVVNDELDGGVPNPSADMSDIESDDAGVDAER